MPRLKSGTNSTKTHFPFSANEVSLILKACSETGVTLLSLGAFHVEFGGRSLDSPITGQSEHSAAAIAGIQTDIAKHSLEMDEVRLREQQLSEMAITDPHRFEEMLQQGELVDDADTGDDE